ncbi:hypothetical protein C8A03DRAFT_40681 [Achaetomium macrosporum]|uniref:Uncharacterized protein n=1 Tax=Achaetomium macrosporum TaxID=79813 RepID=A0AAN7CI04_9PEZI|nr:hypothetical protein C8A03DRAFT_40681 [Achaetomium macrosporum]
MVGSALALSLIGLGAVQALPAGKKPVAERQFSIGDGTGTFIPGQGDLPVCLTDGTPLSEQPPCLLPPITGGLEPPKEKKRAAAEKRQFTIGNPSGGLIPGQGELPACAVDIPLNEQPPCMLPPITGGLEPPTLPPKHKRSFTPGKRSFVLPPDAASNPKRVIEKLELDLERLQNKKNKSQEDLDDIKAIKAALLYLAGITNISAPPGTGSTFTPGKRDAQFDPNTIGTYAAECPNLEGAELALEALMHKDKPTLEERIIMQKLAAFLKGCGITIVKSPDGTWTIIKPSDKRDMATSQLDVTGLQNAYSALVNAAAEVAPSQPSFTNWLALQQIAGVLEIYGASPASSPIADSAGHPKRQTSTKTCQLADVMGLRAALAALLTAYGEPVAAPTNIFLVEQVLVTALQLCGESVPGWTTLTPGSPIPGGPLIPDPTIPGGPMVPDPYKPGSPLKPSDKKREETSDPAALLAALKVLEDAYGSYGSATIPVPVWLIMVNAVTILQTNLGVTVPGWPVLGQGSVVLTPST